MVALQPLALLSFCYQTQGGLAYEYGGQNTASEQSTPDLEKIIMLSDFFGVTTDYILKGKEPVEDKEQKSKELTSRVLYIASTAFVFIGLFCAFGGWQEEQTLETVCGAQIIQAVGIAFMPISMITGYISRLVFQEGRIAPYPVDTIHTFIFCIVFFAVLAISFIIMKRRTRSAHNTYSGAVLPKL